MSTDVPLVFDTSSLMATLLDDDAPGVGVVFDEHVLDLTFYEAGNVVWKTTALQDRLTDEERDRLAGLLDDLRREVAVHTLDEVGFEAVMEVAVDADLTFYDAAHVACAREMEGMLVSEDKELREVAIGRLEVSSIVEL